MSKKRDDEELPTIATGPRLASGGSKRFTIVVTDGRSGGTRVDVDSSMPNRGYAGKSLSCEVRIDDPLASRRHFAFEVRGAVLQIEDLDSTNGTWVNGVMVQAASLLGGETIMAGSTTLRVVADATSSVENLSPEQSFGRVLGASPIMRRLYPLCARLASTTLPVIIEGETGTGKELLAESLHEQGIRSSGPFVVFDCTTVAPNLVESSLFGHERGAFTGAERQHVGVFEQANGGTLFIDEIGDLELPLQAKLLRAIQGSVVRRVGGTRWLKVDVRILCATRRNLEQAIQLKQFREDLFYRLAVARVELPPLRAREGDVTFLARQFWKELRCDDSDIPQKLLLRLQRHPWPGNVRQLYNAVAQAVALGDFEQPGGTSFVPAGVTPPAVDTMARILDQNLPFGRARERVQLEFQRMYVERALDRHGGNVVAAAAASGISRRYFDMIRSTKKPA